MSVIYTASHDPHADLLTQAALPYASIYLLTRYLPMHSNLREALSKAISRGSGPVKWNIPTICQRMQSVVNTFLRYHGWRSDGPLQVHAGLSGWGEEKTQTFAITVRIRRPELLMRSGDQAVPGSDEVRRAEEALAWVLWVLFDHSRELGLKQAVFW